MVSPPWVDWAVEEAFEGDAEGDGAGAGHAGGDDLDLFRGVRGPGRRVGPCLSSLTKGCDKGERRMLVIFGRGLSDWGSFMDAERLSRSRTVM